MDIVAIYHALTVEPAKKEPAGKDRAKRSPSSQAPSKDAVAAYVAAAVEAECNALRGMGPDSGRNDRLNEAAFALGTLVGAGVLDRSDAEAALYSAAMECGLGEGETLKTMASGLDAGEAQPRDMSEVARNSGNGEPNLRSYDPDVDVTGDDAQAFLDEGGEPAEWNPWPYGVHMGRMVYLTEDGEDVKRFPIADFVATIAEEVVDEDGGKTFTLEGTALRGGRFRFEVPAKMFGEDRALRAMLEQAAGARDPVYNRMTGHLVPAIKKLTKDADLTTTRRYRRTGWAGGQFLIPGMVGDGARVELPAKLPYAVDADADLAKGLTALGNLIVAIDPAVTTPIVTMLLEAPLHRLAGFRKKYGVFIQGRTGSLKTSWAQAAMAIYGEGFLDDASLLKWGEGATRNAILQYATAAHDMPFLLDNYKPQTGDGPKGFTNLVHNIIEGGNRERLRRDSSLMASAPIHAFPLCTGEDVPEDDSASLARLFLISFPWQNGEGNVFLSRAQRDGRHLSAVGHAWLSWLSTEEAKGIIAQMVEEFDACRERWSLYLRSIRRDIGNPLRVAENLASNELSWSIACHHPQIGAVLRPFTEQHVDGLRRIAERMANGTADALEALQFLNTLRELLVSKQYVLIQRQIGEPPDFDANKTLGWYDAEGIYLLPTMATAACRRLLGPGSLPSSQRAINDQLEKLGYLAVTGEGSKTGRVIRIGTKTVRVLHLTLRALGGNDDEERSILEELGL